MTTRVGNREVVRVRPFVRVSANLSLSVSELVREYPRLQPPEMLTDGGRTRADGMIRNGPPPPSPMPKSRS